MMRVWISRSLARAAVCLTSATVASASDLKITTVRHHTRVLQNRTDPNTFPDQDWQRTEIVYVHGPLRRFDFGNEQPSRPTTPQTGLAEATIIENCETRELLTLDREAHEYKREKIPSEAAQRAASAERVKRGRGNWSELKMDVESETVALQETKSVFGFVAHHFVTTSHDAPLGKAAVIMGSQSDRTLDAWYIDAPIAEPIRGCTPPDLFAAESAAMQSATREEKHHGPVPHGFIVKSKYIVRNSDKFSGFTETDARAVTELSQASLDLRVFAVPPGYKLVSCLRGAPCPANPK